MHLNMKLLHAYYSGQKCHWAVIWSGKDAVRECLLPTRQAFVQAACQPFGQCQPLRLGMRKAFSEVSSTLERILGNCHTSSSRTRWPRRDHLLAPLSRSSRDSTQS